MNRKRLWGLVPLLALALPLLAQTGKSDNPAKGYRGGKALLKHPFKMSDEVMRLCRALTPEEQKMFDSNPHFHYYAQVYVNPTGQVLLGRYIQATKTYEAKREQLRKKDYRAYFYGHHEEKLFPKLPSFPVGTVLVKEKFNNPKGTGTPELLTAMVKREKGYNPACYDWEFLVLDGKAERILERGKLARCQSCHQAEGYKSTDGVATLKWSRAMPLASFGSR